MVVKIPAGISVESTPGMLKVKGPLGELQKSYDGRTVEVKVEGETAKAIIKIKETRKNHALANTVEAHLKNMISGVSKKFEKKLQLVYSHFPVTLEIKGKDIMIKNFLGEKTPRKAKIYGDAKVDVKGQDIVISGSDVESVGQTASNIIKATHITKRDQRVFQDGIYYA